jgi:hypothetical protein
MTKSLLPIALLVSLLPSCASLMNTPVTSITVHTAQPAMVKSDAIIRQVKPNKSLLIVPRSRQPLVLHVIGDSTQRTLTLKARSSAAFYGNFFMGYGITALFDLKSPKRFTYPRHVYVDLKDSTKNYQSQLKYHEPGELHFQLSVPYANFWNLTPPGETSKHNYSFFGISAGLDYYHSRKQFLNLSVAVPSGCPIPVPAPLDYSGEYERTHAIYVSLSNNHHIGRFTAGYGLQYSYDTWILGYSKRFSPPPPTREPATKSYPSVGAIASVYFHTGPRFKVGAIYRPSVYSFGDVDAFNYQHLISIDFGWKFKLR